MKVLFTYDYGQENMDAVRALGYEALVRKEAGIVYDESLAQVEVLVCYNPFDTLDVSQMKGLKWIQLSSIGIDQVPKSLAKHKELIITNNRGGYSIPMGEWVVLKILEIYKQTALMQRQQQEKKWKMATHLLELYGKTVTFVGTGSIAQESAKRLLGFGVKLLGINTTGRPVAGFDQCYPLTELHQVLAESHVVVLTIPYTEATHHLLDAQALGAMRQDGVLVNVSRGGVIDEQALINCLLQGKLMGAALDVFETEPLPEESPLWTLDQVLVSPHSSWISERRNERRFALIYDNLKRYMKQEPLENRVSLEKGY